jgi:hypothetical protein
MAWLVTLRTLCSSPGVEVVTEQGRINLNSDSRCGSPDRDREQ